MDGYKELYRIILEHDYFEGDSCKSFSLSLTSQGQAMVNRRRLLFRQMGDSEWALFYQMQPAVDDVITFDLSIVDSAFPLYTKWEGLELSSLYELDLPQRNKRIEAIESFVVSNSKRGIGMGLFSIALHLNNKVCEAALKEQPMSTTIHYRAQSAKWSYQFISRNDNLFTANQISLEDVDGSVFFKSFTCDNSHIGAMCTTSKRSIPMRNHYDCHLRLVAYDSNNRRIVLLSSVPPPELGKFLDAPEGTIHNICYF